MRQASCKQRADLIHPGVFIMRLNHIAAILLTLSLAAGAASSDKTVAVVSGVHSAKRAGSTDRLGGQGQQWP